jgi:hypothetical protein
MRLRRSVAAGFILVIGAAGAALTTTTSHAVSSQASSGFTKTETITRDNLDNGKNHVVDKRTVSLKVDQTAGLRGRQEVAVSWSGAHPTGGIVANPNSIGAQQEEYPFVLLECRGVDSTKVKAADRLSPQTCWTQDWSERYQDTFQTRFPAYRLDRYASTADRAQVVGAPTKLPTACTYLPAPTQHWVPFVAADGHVYEDGPAGCAGQPPESQSAGNSALPSNETFGVTGLDGKGTAKFDIWTEAENASLGCSQTVACSLVAVPIMGISCDAAANSLPSTDQPPSNELAADQSKCESDGQFAPGQLMPAAGGGDLAVSGALWWSASNWRNHVSVPLNFAVPADACDVVNASNDVDVYGSELMTQATGEWAPHFCLNSKLFKFTHVQTGEPEARNLLLANQGGAEAAFVSYPPSGGYGRAVVNAPVAVSGFAISYAIDGANGVPYNKLKLDPRLLAKLLTESYPAVLPIKQEDAALANNPLNITLDPEFQALNPGITKGVAASEAASTLLALSSDSDVIEALTTYINDNKAARQWLNGKPDPWGMVVNPSYKKIKLPVDDWPLLSDFEPKAFYASDNNDCLTNSPVPYLPLVAAPMASLAEIGEAMQFTVAQSTTTCSQIDGTSLGEKLVPVGRQTSGFRFMIGLTSLADAHRYQINTAALQTTNAHTFVKPSDNSLKAAAAFLKPDKTTGTWPVPYRTLGSNKKAAGAYPGTMVVYAAVPTTGLPAIDAKDYASLLDFAATSGQTPGLNVGDLPPGYLPLTKANGLASLADYTVAASKAVAAQKGALPSLTGNPAPTPTPTKSPTPTPTSSQSSTPTSTPTTPSTSDDNSTPPAVTIPSSPATTTSPDPGTTPDVAGTSPATVPVALGRTLGINLGGGSLVVVVILGIAILGGLGAPVTYFVGRKRGRW